MSSIVKMSCRAAVPFSYEALPLGHEVFERKNITKIMRECLCEHERSHFDQCAASLVPFSERVRLQDSPTLHKYLAPEFQGVKGDYLEKAHRIALDYCSRPARPIHMDSKHQGFAFRMHPDVLAFAIRYMQEAKGKTVLEIAGASGENAIMLAFAGALRVYMNDLISEEIDAFHNLVRQLPMDVRERLIGVEGDCFDLLQVKPELRGNVDLIVCRNLIHFFPDAKLDAFFSLLKEMLKPGGLAIITANSAYSSDRSVFLENPDVTVFQVIQGILENTKKGEESKKKIFSCVLPVKVPVVELGSQSFDVYERNSKSGMKWKGCQGPFAQPIKDAVQKGCSGDNKIKIQAVECGYVSIVESFTRIFMKDNLANLARKHEFDVVLPFVTSKVDGHCVPDAAVWTHGYQVGVVIRAPEARAAT